MAQARPTIVDRVFAFIRNNRWTAPVLVVGIAIVAIGAFTDSLLKIRQFVETAWSERVPDDPSEMDRYGRLLSRRDAEIEPPIWGLDYRPPQYAAETPIRLIRVGLDYEEHGFPVLSFVIKNDSDSSHVVTNLVVDATYYEGPPAARLDPPAILILTRLIKSIAVWDFYIDDIMSGVRLSFGENKWSKTFTPPDTLIIAASDAAAIQLRLIERYRLGEEEIAKFPEQPLSLVFEFETDLGALVAAPPFDLPQHLSRRRMIDAAGCTPKALPDSPYQFCE